MKNLFYRLIIFLDTANESDTNYNIAWYMAHNFSRVASLGISELAKECFVSPATISRFCRTLGYENFAHLKQECHSFTSSAKRFNNLIDMPFEEMKKNPSKVTGDFANKICSGLSKLEKNLDWSVIDQVLKLIHDSESVAFFGTQFSHSAALHFQTDLLMLEKFTQAHMDVHRQLECIKELDENSVAILVTVNGYYFNQSKMIQYLKKSKAKIVLITANNHLDLPNDFVVSHKILLGQGEDRRVGKHLLLTLMELLSLRYYGLFYPEVENYLVEEDYRT